MFYLRKQYTYRQETGGEGEPGGSEVDKPSAVVEDTPEDKEKASRMGWTDRADFKGDPAKWRPAKEYIERGENMLPILKKNLERSDRKIAELQQSIKEFAEYHTKVEQRAYQRAYQDLKQRQIAAVSEGNAEAFVEIDKEIAQLNKEASEAPKIKAPATDGVHPEYPEWIARNKWAENDMELAAYADAQAQFMRARGDRREGAEFLDAVKERVKKEFPEKFTNPRRESAPSVESAGATQKKGGRTYADLPADAKAACDRMVKNHGIKREEYLKNYDWEA